MSDAMKPCANGRPAGRVQLRLREQGLLEGHVQIASGQALTPLLANGKGFVVIAEAVWPESGRTLDQVTTHASEIIWVRPLDPAIPLIHLTPLQTDYRSVEIVIGTGEVLRGRVAVFKNQSVAELLSRLGRFMPLWRATSVADGTHLGDVVLNREAIETVRDVTTNECVDVAIPSAPAPLHWLVKVAAQLGLTGADNLTLDANAPLPHVWAVVAAAAGIDQDELATRLAAHMRLGVADQAAVDATANEGDSDTFAERYGVRVLSDDGRTLTVATADPMNADAEQALAFASKRRVVFVVASPRALGIIPASSSKPEADIEALLAGMNANGSGVIRVEEEDEPQEIEIGDVSAEPVIKLANLILREAVRQNASDIHLEPDQTRGIIRFRVDGVLRPYMHIPLAALNRVISRFKVLARLDIANRVRPQDGQIRIRVEGERYELRLSTVPTQDSEKAVLRIAGSVHDQTLDQLSITRPELVALRQLLAHRDGIVVVTGPTGSGKTTTLYGALHELNNGKINIMTVEDPVERALGGTTQIHVQPKRGVTFASALRAILRQDPDVILVGEIRDLETAEIAVQAAMTGHLVLTTLHTTSAVGVVNRLSDLGLDRASLAASLRGVLAQRLARRSCVDCAGAGCPSCESTGYRGRVPLMEVLVATPQFTELISRGATFHELQRAALAAGMRPIRTVADERVAAGETTTDEIQRVLGSIEEENWASPEEMDALPPAAGAQTDSTDLMLLPSAAGSEGASNLPATYDRWADPDAQRDTPARRRAHFARALLQGLDRCIAEGQRVDEVMHFACEQLSAAFDSPLVWIGTVEDGALSVRSRAGACAPYVRDIVAQWDDLEAGDGAVATAWRTGAPQARHIEQEPGFDSWREYARAYGLPIFLAVPMEGQNGPIGIVGVHARSAEGLDQQAGQQLVSLVDRITGALERLRQLEGVQLQLSALESAADAVFTTDRRGIIQWVNRAFTQLTGYSSEEAVGQSARLLRSDRHDAAFYKALWDTILGGRPWRGELYNKCKNGGTVVVEQTITPVTNDRGEVSSFLSVQRDISERKQREEAVRTLVNHDSATGLPNGRALDATLGVAVRSAADEGREFSLLLIHVSGSAAVRDSGGHDVGDELIARVAAVLKATLRPGDFLARLGDDEFAALLPNTPSEGAVIAADRLRAAVAAHKFDIEHLPTQPSINIGIAPVDGTQGSRAVLAMADAALYGPRDRKEGVVVSQSDFEESEAATGWGKRIRDALREDQFFLHFQPVVRLSNRSVSHFDALIRLHDEDGDIIPARAFISHAERLGMIPQLDRWVVENVLRLLQVSPDLRVSLNLSASTVTSAPFKQFMQKQKRNLSAVSGRIIFEVAEVGVAQNLARVQESMSRLTELGCCFALDNFGISKGSLTSLGALPVDYVKLDGALIRSIDRDDSALELVQALTTVARALGKEVIAGWAERESIVDLLTEIGIGLAQGHHLGRPSRELRAIADAAAVDDVVGVPARNGLGHPTGRRKRDKTSDAEPTRIAV